MQSESNTMGDDHAQGSAPLILLVEDEDALVDSVRYNLEREGYGVSVASDGRSAIAAFRSNPRRS